MPQKTLQAIWWLVHPPLGGEGVQLGRMQVWTQNTKAEYIGLIVDWAHTVLKSETKE